MNMGKQRKNKTLKQCIDEYNKIKWVNPYKTNISNLIFYGSLYGLFRPKQNNRNNQNNNFYNRNY